MNCPNCGSPVRPGDDFCENCGVLLSGNSAPVASSAKTVSAAGASVAAPPKSATKICPNCSFANPPTEDFCENCGAELSSVSASNSASSSAHAPILAQAPASPSAPTTFKCPRCGNMLSTSDKF